MNSKSLETMDSFRWRNGKNYCAAIKANSVCAAALQVRRYSSKFSWNEFKSVAVKIWLLRK